MGCWNLDNSCIKIYQIYIISVWIYWLHAKLYLLFEPILNLALFTLIFIKNNILNLSRKYDDIDNDEKQYH